MCFRFNLANSQTVTLGAPPLTLPPPPSDKVGGDKISPPASPSSPSPPPPTPANQPPPSSSPIAPPALDPRRAFPSSPPPPTPANQQPPPSSPIAPPALAPPPARLEDRNSSADNSNNNPYRTTGKITGIILLSLAGILQVLVAGFLLFKRRKMVKDASRFKERLDPPVA
ncbi:hypothetical protein KP509_13G018800 [Ceratopteris richardii]|uniref:Uncharacterized protein n=1 Tax=Ceratopteris richardii TaxID=49495 RepID=A0A8T2TFZ7_CERRI|nr:hypothetical protein KP509_13G018800 [Ceratopteris richardii]